MKKLWILILILSLGLVPSCQKPDNPGSEDENQEQPDSPTQEEITQQNTYLYVNTFARNTMNLYYLWNKEIASAIEAWKDTDEPIEKVASIRYHTGVGKNRVDVDRWTKLYDDFSSFYGSVTGNQKTYGFDFTLYGYDDETVCAVVTYTYADSPARKAGLQRGDVIVQVNGKTMNRTSSGSSQLSQEAIDIVYDELIGGDKSKLGLLRYDAHEKKYTQMTLSMESVEMYEDPVLMSKVFDCSGKKVGYLVFTSFTLEACKDLVRVAQEFKTQDVTELILDLRYNGGGFAITESVLASLLAPEEAVRSGSVLSTEIYNARLTEIYEKNGEDTNTYFRTEYTFNAGEANEYTLQVADANIGISKLYAIIASGSASASEAVLCDLFPYLDVTMVGKQSHGKYCSGLMMKGPDFYDDFANQLGENTVKKGKRYTKNWGLYVMYSRFADKNGETRCMPNGLTPDVEVDDDPLDLFQLGDPQETMLAATLKLAGYQSKAPTARKADSMRLPIEHLEGIDPFRPEFGMRIILHK
jgi:C-terminal processing protease CtpA/Prc